MIFATPAPVAKRLIAIKKQIRQRSTTDRLNLQIRNIGIRADIMSPTIPIPWKI
jgi:hypothetical protein